MAEIFNYNTNNIRVVRDPLNITFYSKANLTVSGVNRIIVLMNGTDTVESLDWTDVVNPSKKTFNEYISIIQSWIDEYTPVDNTEEVVESTDAADAALSLEALIKKLNSSISDLTAQQIETNNLLREMF